MQAASPALVRRVLETSGGGREGKGEVPIPGVRCSLSATNDIGECLEGVSWMGKVGLGVAANSVSVLKSDEGRNRTLKPCQVKLIFNAGGDPVAWSRWGVILTLKGSLGQASLVG
jgi:hypothetical protein